MELSLRLVQAQQRTTVGGKCCGRLSRAAKWLFGGQSGARSDTSQRPTVVRSSLSNICLLRRWLISQNVNRRPTSSGSRLGQFAFWLRLCARWADKGERDERENGVAKSRAAKKSLLPLGRLPLGAKLHQQQLQAAADKQPQTSGELAQSSHNRPKGSSARRGASQDTQEDKLARGASLRLAGRVIVMVRERPARLASAGQIINGFPLAFLRRPASREEGPWTEEGDEQARAPNCRRPAWGRAASGRVCNARRGQPPSDRLSAGRRHSAAGRWSLAVRSRTYTVCSIQSLQYTAYSLQWARHTRTILAPTLPPRAAPNLATGANPPPACQRARTHTHGPLPPG